MLCMYRAIDHFHLENFMKAMSSVKNPGYRFKHNAVHLGAVFSFLNYSVSIPLFLASGVVLFPLALWFLSSCLGHINPVWPYVSDLGVVPPEASLFSVFMCGGAAFLCMFALIRYDINQSFVGRSVFVKVEEAPSDAIMKDPAKERQFLHYINLSFASGLMMALGFLLIGCFRHNEIPIVQLAHNVFAAVGFLSVLVDIYLEMRISVLLGNEQVARYRRIIFALCILFLVVYNTSGVASFVTNPKMFEKKEPRLMWSESDTGYFLHLISTFVEWLLIYQLSPYFATYHRLFARARYLHAPISNSPS